MEQRGRDLAGKPACDFVCFFSQGGAQLWLFQRHTSAIPDRLEAQLNRRYFSRLPGSATPFQCDLLRREPTGYAPHFYRALHDAAMGSWLKLHSEIQQRRR
jgi:hypothetical protein